MTLDVSTVVSLYKYETVDDLCIITCFFNPCGYRTRRLNYDIFCSTLAASGIRLATIECAFGSSPFTLDGPEVVLRVRGSERHLMWQKERLLNLLVSCLPTSVHKVAWLDCDILFENPDWARKTSRALDSYAIVQPFTELVRLRPGSIRSSQENEVRESYCSVLRRDRTLATSGNYQAHGHTGLGWAARRDLIQGHGLYDVLISGSGDHFIAHAADGSLGSVCFDGMRKTPLFENFSLWAVPFSQSVGGLVGCVAGRALHLWHGGKEGRRYRTILRELVGHNYDPTRDVGLSESGLLEWKSERPMLHSWASGYFRERDEDNAGSEISFDF